MHDRRQEDQRLIEFERRIDLRLDAMKDRIDRHEEEEFARYDRMTEEATRARETAEENSVTLKSILKSIEEPLKVYETGKSGVVIIHTSGKVLKFFAGVVGAVAVIWAAVSQIKLD